MKQGFRIEVAQRNEGKDGVELRMWLEGESGSTFLRMTFDTKEELTEGIKKVKDRLDAVLVEAGDVLQKGTETQPAKADEFKAVDDPAENWKRLEALETIGDFFRAFNKMSEERRRAVADHALTQENIFKGRASVFSLHYNEDTCALE